MHQVLLLVEAAGDPMVSARQTTYSASLEVGHDGWCTVWIAELPGLFVNMSSERAALRALPEAVTAYLQWLESHGELSDPPRRIAVKVTERHRVPVRLRWGGYAALHGFERSPVTPEDLVRCMRLMGDMRADTLRLLEGLPRAALDWSRPGQTRTIKEHLLHVASSERGYLERLRLGPLPAVGRVRHPVERLTRARVTVSWRLMRLTPEERTRVVKTDGEWWSLGKVLRRLLYHERYHIRSVARILRYHGSAVPDGLGGWPRY
ncbi:MAG: DinB family protein [Armatimonadota bacterium]|nr:DinB family protein [Armatimonadota bacterium]MDR7518623.1 DinB family protein [Armatimonadota bacterium]MDR7548490.1 DinB family protein [Armatimonadota bacterium]